MLVIPDSQPTDSSSATAMEIDENDITIIPGSTPQTIDTDTQVSSLVATQETEIPALPYPELSRPASASSGASDRTLVVSEAPSEPTAAPASTESVAATPEPEAPDTASASQAESETETPDPAAVESPAAGAASGRKLRTRKNRADVSPPTAEMLALPVTRRQARLGEVHNQPSPDLPTKSSRK